MPPSPSPKPPVCLHKGTRVKCLCTFPEKKKKKLLAWVEFIYPMRIFNIMNYFHHITYFLLVSSYSFIYLFLFLFFSYSFIYCLTLWKYWGFPGNSAGKESTCNAGDPSLIPQSGRSDGEGIGYRLQYSWPSLVTHMVKNPPAKQETQFCSLGWEDPWRRERLPTPVFWENCQYCGEFHGLYGSWGHKESDTTEWLSLSHENTSPMRAGILVCFVQCWIHRIQNSPDGSSKYLLNEWVRGLGWT